jgi:hypothetical protein
MPPRSDSQTEGLIRQWLSRLGVNFQRDVAPHLPLWLETFGGMDPEVLRLLFERAMRTCTFFPAIAEILAPLGTAEEGSFEDEWQALLGYCERWVNRDVPNMPGKPALPPDIDHAARAAGGVYYLESCSTEDLVWAKKRFIEDLARQRKTGDIAGFLPGSELRALLSTAAPFQLPPAAAEYFRLPGAGSALPRTEAPTPEGIPQSIVSAGPGPTHRHCPEHSAEMSALIARGESLHREQSEKIFAAWRVSHGIRAAEPVAAAPHQEAVKQDAAQ